MVYSSTLRVNGGTLTRAIASVTQHRHHQHYSVVTSRHNQHRLDNAIASTTQSRRHQVKQHPHICLHMMKIRSCTSCVVELDAIRIIAHHV
jgi:hypothetical protein